MSTIAPYYRNLKQLLQSQSFSIDEYQREYKWEKKNVDELLTDFHDKFSNCYHTGDTVQKIASYEDYFLGSIIICKRNGKNYLIDGQQRLTSLTLLLIYLYHAAVEKNLPVASTMAPLIYSDNLGTPCFNLDIAERLPVIEALFNGVPFSPSGQDESIQTMYARYGDIESKDLVGELGEALPHFIYWLMEKVGLIEIATNNDNYAYEIFETMNDRGKPLSPVDMLKAYLLAPVEDVQQRRLANQTWKNNVLKLISLGGVHEPERDASCIKAWMRAQYADSTRDRKAGSSDKDWELIGSAFHRWARENSGRIGLGSSSQNLAIIQKHLPFFSNAYELIFNASMKYTPSLEAVYYNAHNEFTWQNTVLLAPLCIQDDLDTIKRKISATAIYLDIWLMRRVVNYIRVGYSSTAYTMFTLCRDIRGKNLTELQDILISKLDNDDATFAGSPSRGRAGIADLNINQFSRRYIFHLLARLTSFVEVGSGKPDLFDNYVDRTVKNPFDIEHIMPNDFGLYKSQFMSREEFHSARSNIGGLLLLPADVNRSFQDKPFKDKAPHYAKENLYAASLTSGTYLHKPQFAAFQASTGISFTAYTDFGKSDLLERKSLVEKLVELVWAKERIRKV